MHWHPADFQGMVGNEQEEKMFSWLRAMRDSMIKIVEWDYEVSVPLNIQ